MNLTTKKQAFASSMVSIADEMLLLAHKMDEITAAYTVNGFDTGPNVFVDADFTSSNQHLSPSIVADVMFALATLRDAATVGVRNSLRKGISGGVP